MFFVLLTIAANIANGESTFDDVDDLLEEGERGELRLNVDEALRRRMEAEERRGQRSQFRAEQRAMRRQFNNRRTR